MRNPTSLVTIALLAASSVSFAGPAAAKQESHREVAIVAAGCFWGVENWMQKLPGVIDVEVGYVGGTDADATYEEVKTGKTGHAEAVRIVFDPTVTSYPELLTWFFKIHDPTTLNRQGNDVGTQYRSAIFPTNPKQAGIAQLTRMRVARSHAWARPLTTTIEAPTNWVRAESYHQDYLVKHPGGYDNHYERKLTF